MQRKVKTKFATLNTYIKWNWQTDKQTNRQKAKQTNRQPDKQTNGLNTDLKWNRQIDKQTNGLNTVLKWKEGDCKF
jgi:hypothetical protein